MTRAPASAAVTPAPASAAVTPAPDPFGVELLREATLTTWRTQPNRLREDLAAERDLVTGGYRDRLVVELLQNAADAAAEAGVPCRVLLEVTADGLACANTGAPLGAAGVAALSSLHASTKTGTGATGRFGVGFCAVLTVTDEPSVASAAGAVGWSRTRTLQLVGEGPTLRLPFVVEGGVPAGYDTAVRLPFRDASARTAAVGAVRALDPSLLLVLPALVEVVTVVDGVHRVLRLADGTITDDHRSTTWAVARDGAVVVAVPVAFGLPTDLPAGIGHAVRAPQPTADPSGLPVVVAGPFPVDATRRHVRPGAESDEVARTAGRLLGGLLTDLLTPDRPDALAPLLARPAGAVDAAVLAAARAAVVLPGRRVLDDGTAPLVEVLTDGVLEDLLPATWSGRRWEDLLARLDVQRLDTAGWVTLLAGAQRPPEFWGRLVRAASGVHDAEALAGLPVPLADGRTVTGARGSLLPVAGVDPALLAGAELTLRVIHPEAAAGAEEAWLRLGARVADADELLGALRPDGEELTDAVCAARARLVLALVGSAAPQPWLAEVLLPTSDGDLRPAGELLLPGGRLAAVVDTGAGFGEPARGLGTDEQLVAVGVLDTFAVLDLVDVELTDPALLDGPLGDVDGIEDWLDDVLGDATHVLAPRLLVVRDLDLVREDAWRAALALLPLPALADVPVLVDGRPVTVASPARWWLAEEPVLDGARPVDLALAGPGAAALDGLWPSPPPWLSVKLAAGLGVRTALPSGTELLARLAEPASQPARASLAALHVHALDDPLAEPAALWRTADGLVANPVVLDAPDLLPLVGRPWLPLPADRAVEASRRWVLPLASRLASFEVLSTGTERDGWVEHVPLLVADVDGAPVQVAWRVVGGVVHASSPRGLGLGRAWLAGRWADREGFVADAEGRSDQAQAERDLDTPTGAAAHTPVR